MHDLPQRASLQAGANPVPSRSATQKINVPRYSYLICLPIESVSVKVLVFRYLSRLGTIYGPRYTRLAPRFFKFVLSYALYYQIKNKITETVETSSEETGKLSAGISYYYQEKSEKLQSLERKVHGKVERKPKARKDLRK